MFRVFLKSTLVKLSKSSEIASSFIPMPVSVTEKLIFILSLLIEAILISKIT